MSELEQLFDLNTNAVPASMAPKPTLGSACLSSSLPPLHELGSGISKTLRGSGNSKHTFLVLSKQSSEKDVVLTTLMTKAPSDCADTVLEGSFACFQATSPAFEPNEPGDAYEASSDKQVRTNGGARCVNTMVLPKAVISDAIKSERTPYAFKTQFRNFELAPQGDIGDLTVQYGVAIVKFHLLPGKRGCPAVYDEFTITNFVVPVKLPGEKKEDGHKGYHAGGSLGILPYHSISSEDLVVIGQNSAKEMVARALTSPETQAANLAVLSSSPAASFVSLDATGQTHLGAVSQLTYGLFKEMAGAFMPTICDASTVGKREARSVYMDEDAKMWARAMGEAANDPYSCGIGNVSNMLLLTTTPKLGSVEGVSQVLSSHLMEVALKMVKGELKVDDLSPDTLVATSIAKFAERDFVSAPFARANARNAPRVMEMMLEVAITTPGILMDSINTDPRGAIGKFQVYASCMTHHITAALGVDQSKLSSDIFSAIKPVASITIAGSLAQNNRGMDLQSDKAKETIKNGRALRKELGVSELDLITSPEAVWLNTEATLGFALKLTSEYVKAGLGMQGGGDFLPETMGSIVDDVERACAAARAKDEETAAQYNRKSSFSKPKVLQASNLKLAKDAAFSCINQDGAVDVRGVVYAFLPSHNVVLHEYKATLEKIDSTEFGETTLNQRLDLDGVPGELVRKMNHGLVYLVQKRLAATTVNSGRGASVPVEQGGDFELDLSYMEEMPPAKKAKN